jgi:hypothetical protein
LGSTFFGLPPDYKKYLYEEILSLSYYSEGAISWIEAYSMPVHIRRFTINVLSKIKSKEKAQIESSSKGTSPRSSSNSIARPNINRK